MDNSGITILNVDGNEVGLCVKSRILREAGYRVIEARSGAEAARLALSESPRLVLLSADLPDLSGFEALARIKTEATLTTQASPPLVLLLSATFVGCEKRARALEEGADGYLLEPATPEFLLANIRMLLRRQPAALDIARSPAGEGERSRALENLARLSLAVNSAESLDEILRIAAGEARKLIGAHQAAASLNPDALDPNDPIRLEAGVAVSLSEKYAGESPNAARRRCETWFSWLVCRLNQPMRLRQAEIEAQEDEYRHPQALEGIVTPRELECLRRIASLREVAGSCEVATRRETAGLREAAAARNPQMLRGLDMRGWLAAPLAARDRVCERNLGLIQLSDKYDGEFTERDEIALAEFARIVSIAIENLLRLRREQALREAAEDAAVAKDEFMAMTSYKLRAQLNTMLGWSWVLRRQADNINVEGVTRAAEIIERAARTQARLVEDLMEASRGGAVKWREGETAAAEGSHGEIEAGTANGGNRGMREGEALRFSVSPLRVSPISPPLRPTVHYSHNPAPRGMAARGGC